MPRNYSNIAIDTTLSAGIAAGDLSLTVASATGWPAAPFAAVLDPGSATEEVVQVTAKAGTTWTVTRGFDGTTAAAHSSGVTVRHAAIAGDFTDLQAADTSEASARAAADTTLQTNITAEASARSSADALLTPMARTLTINGTAFDLSANRSWTVAGSGTVAGTGTAGRVAQWAAGGANIEDSTLAKTGAGLLTLEASGALTGTPALLGTVNAFTAAQSIAASTAGSLLGVTQSGAGAAVQVDTFGSGSAMSLFSYGGGPAFFAFSFTTLSYVADVVRLYRGMFGGSDPADGFGSQLTFELEDDSHTARVATAFESTLATAAAASWKGRYRLLVGDSGGSREVLRGQGTGSAAAIGFLGAAAVVRQTVSAAATDPATTQTLVNDIRTALINLGLAA